MAENGAKVVEDSINLLIGGVAGFIAGPIMGIAAAINFASAMPMGLGLFSAFFIVVGGFVAGPLVGGLAGAVGLDKLMGFTPKQNGLSNAIPKMVADLKSGWFKFQKAAATALTELVEHVIDMDRGFLRDQALEVLTDLLNGEIQLVYLVPMTARRIRVGMRK